MGEWVGRMSMEATVMEVHHHKARHHSSNRRPKPYQPSTVTTKYRPGEAKLPVIYKELGLEYDEKVLPSIGNEILKSVIAQFNADQLLTECPKVSALVRDRLTQRAKDFNIELDA